MPASTKTGTYVPRQTQDCDAVVLMRQHLPGFLARLEESGHAPLPKFVQAELEGVGVVRRLHEGLRADGLSPM